MRRSTVVQLTLLPMLATAAVAAAQPGPDDPPPDAAAAAGAPDESSDAPVDLVPGDLVIEPPGLTPTILELDCDDDPNWRMRSDCFDVGDDVVVRGGFGGYFWSSHG